MRGEVRSLLHFHFDDWFCKPTLAEPWKSQRLVLCSYLGMGYVTGGRVLAFPLNQDQK